MEKIIICLISFAMGMALTILVLRKDIFKYYRLNRIEAEMVNSLLKDEGEEGRVNGVNKDLVGIYSARFGTLGGAGSGAAWPKVDCECSGEDKAEE
jgi:hypothetical protein